MINHLSLCKILKHILTSLLTSLTILNKNLKYKFKALFFIKVLNKTENSKINLSWSLPPTLSKRIRHNTRIRLDLKKFPFGRDNVSNVYLAFKSNRPNLNQAPKQFLMLILRVDSYATKNNIR
ncbi:MAG: hypothetical protein CML39_04845 [Rhodobacteraceae bacterium]|nr:MAG: hypothetical protein CML39_04845 [Paracoccaceae bacterium]